MNLLGIDIGGSTTKSALVSAKGQISNYQETPTSQKLDQILADLKKIINTNDELAGIGICVPGLIDSQNGIIKQVVNIPSLDNFELTKLITPFLPFNPFPPIFLLNDADAALLGEHWIGAAKDYKNIVMLTLGTGVGGAAMLDGQLLPHPSSLEEEIGHWQVDDDDKFKCNAGVAGSIEAKIGGHCVLQRYQMTLEEIADKTRAGDDMAKNHFTDLSYWFHAILEHADNKFHPDIFVIGGSGAESLDLFLDGVDPIKPVIKAKLGQKAGIVGVAKQIVNSFYN